MLFGADRPACWLLRQARLFTGFRICSHIRNKVFNTNMLRIPQNADVVNCNLDDFNNVTQEEEDIFQKDPKTFGGHVSQQVCS